MINRFALSFLCIELDRNEICGVMLLYILLSSSNVKMDGDSRNGHGIYQKVEWEGNSCLREQWAALHASLQMICSRLQQPQ